MTAKDAAYNAIRRRHPAIPQDTLPMELPAVEHALEAPVHKPRPAKALRYAKCPKCLADKDIAVIRMSDGRHVFRDHTKTLGKGARVPCPGSGTVAPEAKPYD